MFLFRSAPRVREAPQKSQNLIFLLETSMSTNRSKDRSSLCSFTFADGRQRRVIPSAARDLLFAVVVAGAPPRPTACAGAPPPPPPPRRRSCVKSAPEQAS